MANKLALGLVIGGAVSSTVGSAFKDVTSRIKRLEAEGKKARVLEKTIGDTMRLRDEWRKAHMAGEKGAGALLKQLESNLSSLKKQGVEVRNLAKSYNTMGQMAAKAELKAKGHHQLDEGKKRLRNSVGQAQTVGNDLSHLGAVLSVARPAWGYEVDPLAMPDARRVLRKLGMVSKSKERNRWTPPPSLLIRHCANSTSF